MLWWQPHSLFPHLQSVFFTGLVGFFHWKIFIVLLKLVSGCHVKEDHEGCVEWPCFSVDFILFMMSQNYKAQFTRQLLICCSLQNWDITICVLLAWHARKSFPSSYYCKLCRNLFGALTGLFHENNSNNKGCGSCRCNMFHHEGLLLVRQTTLLAVEETATLRKH